MEDAISHNPKPQSKIQEINSNNENPSKFLSHFLYKATLVTVFLVLLPLFPFQAPEFINQTVNSRSWELIQLIFVGIAVSYGLFSKKNDDEIEKEVHSSKVDNAQTYVSKLLQVSSVFDDESENPTVIDENKVQTVWNSQYYREEPVVVTAKENPVSKQVNSVVSSGSISQKPLLLPVRSLRQRVFDPNEVDLVHEKSGSISKSSSSSSSSSKRFTSNVSLPKNGEFGGMDFKKGEEKTEENVVLRSPIPWRSRSGRMEIDENRDSPESSKLETRSFRPNPTSKNLSPSPSMSSSPRKLSNSTSFTSETQAKSSEDVVRKTSLSSPPPPPPPPPFLRKSMLMKSNSSTTNNSVSSEKEFRRSISEIQDDVSKSGKFVRRFTSSEPNIREEKKSTNYEMKSNEKNGYTNNMINEKVPKELAEKVLMETTTDEESEGESEDDYFEQRSGNGEVVEIGNSSNDVGPDVDKKADEFIAKFREQIRLQRIESIRKSTAQRSGKNLR